MKRLMKTLMWIGLIYGGYCLALFLLQRAMLFPRILTAPASPAAPQAPGIERIWLPAPSGSVEAWYLPPVNVDPAKPGPVVIFAHGNAELIDFCAQELRPFTQWGVGVLLVEFPGYGRSEGTPSQYSIVAAFKSAYDTITRRAEVDPKAVILYGRSVGGGAVCALSRERPAAALILMSTFTSVRSFSLRYLVPSFLVRDPFDNLSAVGAFPGPVLIFHGTHDEMIPYRHGTALDRASVNSRLITYECGHNDCPPDPIQFWREIKGFLESSGVLKRQ